MAEHSQAFRASSLTRHSGTIEQLAWNTWQSLERTQWLERAQLEAWQFERLHELLTHCAQHVPFYRRLFGDNAPQSFNRQNIMQVLRDIPVVDRKHFASDMQQMASECLPPGMTHYGNLSTSGTTGIPVKVKTTELVQAQWLAFTLRDLQWCGISPMAHLAAIRCSGAKGDQLARLQRGLTLPNWGKPIADLVETGVGHFMDVSAAAEQQLAWLGEIQPEYLLSYPSNLELLASLQQRSDGKFQRLKGIQSIAETLRPESKQLIESAFGVPVFNTYSCCEAGYLASPCPSGDGFHVHAENVILELLNDQHLPCQPGETGRVVVTALHNFAIPFVRYDIHDEAESGATQCACGRGLPTLKQIFGKRRPMLRLPDGRLKSSSGMAIALRSIERVLQYQVLQAMDGRVTIKILPRGSWSDADQQQLTQRIVEFFEGPIPMNLELVQRIEPTSSGKVLDVIVQVQGHAAT